MGVVASSASTVTRGERRLQALLFLTGLLAALVTIAFMLLLRRVTETDSLLEIVGEATLQVMPMAMFSLLLETLQQAGVPCGPINTIADVVADPQVAARNMVVSVDDPALAALRVAGNPIKLSAYADPSSRPAAPALDGDRRRILAELVA